MNQKSFIMESSLSMILKKLLVSTYCSNTVPRICILKHLYAIQLLEREVWKPELNKCLLCFKKSDIISISTGLKLSVKKQITRHEMTGYKFGKCIICGSFSIINNDDICKCCVGYRKMRQRLSNKIKIIERIKRPVVTFKKNLNAISNFEGLDIPNLLNQENIPMITLIDIMENLEDKILSLLKASKCVNMFQEVSE